MSKQQQSGSFRMTVNDCELVRVIVGGRWTFDCPDYPEIERGFENATDAGPCIAAFVRRAGTTETS